MHVHLQIIKVKPPNQIQLVCLTGLNIRYSWHRSLELDRRDMAIVSADDTGYMRLWYTDVAGPVLRGHEGPVKTLMALPDNTLVSCSDDHNVRIWSSDGAPLGPVLKV